MGKFSEFLLIFPMRHPFRPIETWPIFGPSSGPRPPGFGCRSHRRGVAPGSPRCPRDQPRGGRSPGGSVHLVEKRRVAGWVAGGWDDDYGWIWVKMEDRT